MLSRADKIIITISGLCLIVGVAIAAPPSDAKFAPQPNPAPTCGCIGGSGTR